VGKEGRGLDVLFNNAGVNMFERRLSKQGFELQFATNYLGPWLFTNLLIPLMLSPPSSSPAASPSSYPAPSSKGRRIINTSSEAHRISPVRFSDLHQTPGITVLPEEAPRRGLPHGVLRGKGGYEPSIAYAQSKTAQILHSVCLNKRGITSLAVMPGSIMTDIVRDLDQHGMENLVSTVEHWKTADQGAASLIVAAFDPGLNDSKGDYMEDCQLKHPSKWASDPEKAERLWRLSVEMVGEKFDFKKGSVGASKL